jgi:hypothetical protein
MRAMLGDTNNSPSAGLLKSSMQGQTPSRVSLVFRDGFLASNIGSDAAAADAGTGPKGMRKFLASLSINYSGNTSQEICHPGGAVVAVPSCTDVHLCQPHSPLRATNKQKPRKVHQALKILLAGRPQSPACFVRSCSSFLLPWLKYSQQEEKER